MSEGTTTEEEPLPAIRRVPDGLREGIEPILKEGSTRRRRPAARAWAGVPS